MNELPRLLPTAYRLRTWVGKEQEGDEVLTTTCFSVQFIISCLGYPKDSFGKALILFSCVLINRSINRTASDNLYEFLLNNYFF